MGHTVIHGDIYGDIHGFMEYPQMGYKPLWLLVWSLGPLVFSSRFPSLPRFQRLSGTTTYAASSGWRSKTFGSGAGLI